MATSWEEIKRANSSTAGRAEMLCRAVAPLDLAGVPLYILTAGEVPPMLRRSDCNAYTTPLLDLQLRATLLEQGRWQGRGVAMILNNTLDCVGAQQNQFIRVVLHELAHRLDGHRKPGTFDTAEREAIPPRVLAAIEGEDINPPITTTPALCGDPWRLHGPKWIRAAVHLAARARLAGFHCTATDLDAGAVHYGLAGAQHYERALGVEPLEMLEQSLFDISQSELPAALARLWQADVEAWHARQAA